MGTIEKKGEETEKSRIEEKVVCSQKRSGQSILVQQTSIKLNMIERNL
jgi:hypothetical protein